MSENTIFNLVGAGTKSPFGGYVSATDRTTIAQRYIVKGSKNVYLKNTGTIANRPGLLRRGSADGTLAGIIESIEWDTSLGYTRPIRIVNGKLQVESDIVTSGTYVWYDLLTVTSTEFSFDLWYNSSTKKDILLMSDGTVNMQYWNGGIGKISSTTVNTIVLTDTVATQGFATASGTVIINGTEYAYTGSTASTLTGVTPDPTSQANGSAVIEKPVTQSNVVASDYVINGIKVINNQLHTFSSTKRPVYISKNTSWTDFTKSSPRAVGDGDVIYPDEIPTGIGEREGKAHIGTRKAWYEISFTKITIGSNLSEQTNVKKIPMALKKGLLGHKFVGNRDNDMIYVAEDHQVYKYGSYTNQYETKLPSLSYDIQDELKFEDFTGGHMRIVGDYIYITAPNNGRVWIHETMTRVNRNGNIETDMIWHAPFIWNISRIAVINGVEYGHSNANPQIYQLWDTLQWHDDSPSDEALPYDSVVVFGYRAGNRHDYTEFNKIYIEGYMTQGTDLRGALAYEYKGERSTQEFYVNFDGTTPEFYIGDIGTALGDASLGDNPLGDRTSDIESDQELLPKFRSMATAGIEHVHEYQPRLYTEDIDARFELLVIGDNSIISEEQPTSLST